MSFLLIPTVLAAVCLVGGAWLLFRGAKADALMFDDVSRLDAYRSLLRAEIQERAKGRRR